MKSWEQHQSNSERSQHVMKSLLGNASYMERVSHFSLNSWFDAWLEMRFSGMCISVTHDA